MVTELRVGPGSTPVVAARLPAEGISSASANGVGALAGGAGSCRPMASAPRSDISHPMSERSVSHWGFEAFPPDLDGCWPRYARQDGIHVTGVDTDSAMS